MLPSPAFCLLVTCLLARCALGQLAPERLYYGIRGRIEMDVRRPEPAAPANSVKPSDESTLFSATSRPGGAASAPTGDLEIALLTPEDKVVERASVVEGRVDLASLFPRLWSTEKPVPLFAQLRDGGVPIGPAVVLQPMLAPERATAVDPRGVSVRFALVGVPYYSGIRAYAEKAVVLETSAGELRIRLRPDAAPNTAWNFRQLVEGGFYTNIEFHRIVAGDAPDRGFVLQAGDPLANGLGGPGYFIPLEKSTLEHDLGVVSMARLSQPDSGGSQFFVCLSREACKALDGGYAAFGQVIQGLDVVRKLARTPVDPKDKPLEPPMIRTAKLVDATPRGVARAPEPEKKQDDSQR